MREEIKTGSISGVVLKSMSFGQKAASLLVACGLSALLVIVPQML